MNNYSPLVSIVIPVYNGANYLGEAIDSALNQTYTNIEIIVVNDGSTDEGRTRNIALTYGPKILYFEKENGGVASALNFAIKKMHGEYFSWLSHDDLYTTDKITLQVGQLSKLDNKKETILYSNYCFISEDSTFLSTPVIKHVGPDAFRPYFIMGGLIHGCSLLVPKFCFVECGNFKEELKATQDYDLWFRFSNQFTFVHMPVVLVKSRQHPNQDTHKLKKTVLKEGNALLLYFLRALRKKEIMASYEKPLPIYYLDFSNRNLGYVKAARYSFLLALINFWYIRNGFIYEYVQKLIRTSKNLLKANI